MKSIFSKFTQKPNVGESSASKPKPPSVRRKVAEEEAGKPYLKPVPWYHVEVSEKFAQISGLFLLGLSVFFFYCIISYCFSWKAMQSEIFALGTPAAEVISGGNWTAQIGHYLVYEKIGIFSLLFVFALFFMGWRLVRGVHLVSPWRWIRRFVFLLFWGPLFTAAILPVSWFLVHGKLGYDIRFLLQDSIGVFGLLIFSVVWLLCFIILEWNVSFRKVKEDATAGENTKSEDMQNTESEIESSEHNSSEVSADTHSRYVEESVGESSISTSVEQVEKETPITKRNPVEEGNTATVFSLEETKPQQSKTSSSLVGEEEMEIVIAEETLKSEESTLPESAEQDKEDPLGHLEEYDPKKDLSDFKLPNLEIMKAYDVGSAEVNTEELHKNKQTIVETLNNYKIEISSIKATVGPTITLYEIVPAPGVRISKIKGLENDIALSLAALGIRIIAPLPGKGTIGIEVPNGDPKIVSMRSVLQSEKFIKNTMELPLALGKTISNETFVADLAKMPHLLMAGATGQGKSVGLNAILTSLLYQKHPAELKFVLVDPKKVELTLFNLIEKHYLAKIPDGDEAIITDNKLVINTVNSLCIEMDDRYELLKKAHCRNIKEYNTKFKKRKLNPNNNHRFLPYIVLVIDEFADLIMTAGKDIELPIARLAQLARAVGIHLIIATQRPTTNIITGTIKANFPARIAFRVTSGLDSRTILDASGANQLIGRGDMLFTNGNDLVRVQCAFVDTPEVEQLCQHIQSQRGYTEPFILPEVSDEGEKEESSVFDISYKDRDSNFEDAARIVVMNQQGSTSLIQRKLKLGYNRSGRIMDQLEYFGIVGGFQGSKARDVLIPDELSLEQLLESLSKNNA